MKHLLFISILIFSINCGEDKSSEKETVKEDIPKIENTREEETVVDITNYKVDKIGNILKVYFKPWNPKSIKEEKDKVTIILDQRRITNDIFGAMIRALCGSVWLDKTVWKGNPEFIILNMHEKQGMIFEGNAQDCANFGKLQTKDLEINILSKSRIY